MKSEFWSIQQKVGVITMQELKNTVTVLVSIATLLYLIFGGINNDLNKSIALLRSEVRHDIGLLRSDLQVLNNRLSYIDGWIEGRFREGAAE